MVLIRTPLCDVLGIEYPIIQGGMAWVATGELAAAVSEAGGLGVIGAGSAPPQVVVEEIRKTRELTSRPFGVNVYYMSPWVDEIIDVVIEENVPVITTGAGNPGKHIPVLKEAGIKILPVVASVALARRLERLGVDGIIAEGMECGGHVGELTTMALIPQVAAAVDIPVVAAGGIASGRGLAAAFALGATGVQLGTLFVCATECIVHDNYKQAIIKAKDRDTVLTGFPGYYVRVLNNKLAKQYKDLELGGASVEELEKLGVGKLKAAAIDGDVETGSVMLGQIAGLIKTVQPARDIIEDLVQEAENVIRDLNRFI